MKIFGITILILIGMVALWGIGLGLGFITLTPHVVSNKIQMNHDIIDRTVNADTCLQMQDWFRTQEGTIKTLQTTVQNNQEQLDTFNREFPDPTKWTDSQSQQASELQANVSGAKSEANDAINTYDAKSQQENLAYCKNGLPLFIHPF